ncbi:MAG: MarR family transcriptional regulator [Akkermansiaceae bacterium]|nr:MarR family transcriptional regulator [Akkermansiaceae bacterium]
MKIPEKYRAGEGTQLEFKLILPAKDKKVLKTIVAFANGDGGSIIFGVDDVTHEVVGIESENLAHLMDSITDMICSACEPLIIPEISLRTFGKKTVLQVDVPPGEHLPYYIKKEGPVRGVYVRVGATTRVADAEILYELQLKGARVSYDETVERSTLPMREEELRQFEADVKARRGGDLLQLSMAQLVGRKLLEEKQGQYYPTVAFRLMTRADLHFSGIQCAVFKGTDKVHFLDRKEIKGTVQSQIDEAMLFLRRNLRVGAEIKGVYRKDVPELPLEALRETVANAVMHRNYLAHAFIQVSVYDDRVEVYSPGKLPSHQTLEKMMSGASYLRNPVLADMFQQMRLAEHWGTGIRRVRDACLENGLQPPTYECDDMGVKVTYMRPDMNAPRIPKKHLPKTEARNASQEKVLTLISELGRVSVAQIMEHMSCSRSTAMRLIAGLLEQNLITKSGTHKNVRYVLSC